MEYRQHIWSTYWGSAIRPYPISSAVVWRELRVWRQGWGDMDESVPICTPEPSLRVCAVRRRCIGLPLPGRDAEVTTGQERQRTRAGWVHQTLLCPQYITRC